jgi:oligopeptide/dipeptide ABC transporter ATP-binding protein
LAKTSNIFDHPAHPYTSALLSSVPKLVLTDDTLVSFDSIEGEIPSPLAPPHGCHFAPRRRLAQDVCRGEAPTLREIRPDQLAACYFSEKLDTDRPPV